MPTYRVDLAYDGTGFHGYARQEGLRTVQGEFETALFHRTGEWDAKAIIDPYEEIDEGGGEDNNEMAVTARVSNSR